MFRRGEDRGMCLWLYNVYHCLCFNMLCIVHAVYYMTFLMRTTLSQQPLVRFIGESYRATGQQHIQQQHSFIFLPMQMLRVTVEPGWLQHSISVWLERFSVGVCRTGTHITALWARQPLFNYCKPSQALLRHALNFAQDRWGPAEYAAKPSVPSANHCCLRG